MKKTIIFLAVLVVAILFEFTLHETSHVVVGTIYEDLSIKEFSVIPPRVTMVGPPSEKQCPRHIAPLFGAGLWFLITISILVHLKTKKNPCWFWVIPFVVMSAHDMITWLTGYLLGIPTWDGGKFLQC